MQAEKDRASLAPLLKQFSEFSIMSFLPFFLLGGAFYLWPEVSPASAKFTDVFLWQLSPLDAATSSGRIDPFGYPVTIVLSLAGVFSCVLSLVLCAICGKNLLTISSHVTRFVRPKDLEEMSMRSVIGFYMPILYFFALLVFVDLVLSYFNEIYLIAVNTGHLANLLGSVLVVASAYIAVLAFALIGAAIMNEFKLRREGK